MSFLYLKNGYVLCLVQVLNFYQTNRFLKTEHNYIF